MPDAHLSASELTRWRDEGAGDRDRIVAHLAGCADCRRIAADLELERPPGFEPPVRFRPGEFVAEGHGAGSRQGVKSRAASRVVYLAAAASIVLAAMIVPTWLRNRSESAARGGGPPVVLVRPVDSAVAVQDLAFEWTTNAGLDRARLFVVAIDDPARPLIDREVTGTRYQPAPEERRGLHSGRELHWFLEYRDGTATATSPSARFRLR